MYIREGVDIHEWEIRYSYSRSSGPGGQNVNKLDTRVTLILDLAASASLTDEQKARLQKRLANRINRRGELRVASQKHRSQWKNREEALGRFRQILAKALERRKPRRKNQVPAVSRVRRLEEKSHRSRTKELRRGPDPSEY